MAESLPRLRVGVDSTSKWGSSAKRDDPDLTGCARGDHDVVSGEKHPGFPWRQRHAFRNRGGDRIDEVQLALGVVHHQYCRTSLHNLDLRAGGLHDSVQLADEGVGPADDLKRAVGHPDRRIVQIHPLRAVTAGDDRHGGHQDGNNRTARRGRDERFTAGEPPTQHGCSAAHELDAFFAARRPDRAVPIDRDRDADPIAVPSVDGEFRQLLDARPTVPRCDLVLVSCADAGVVPGELHGVGAEFGCDVGHSGDFACPRRSRG